MTSFAHSAFHYFSRLSSFHNFFPFQYVRILISRFPSLSLKLTFLLSKFAYSTFILLSSLYIILHSDSHSLTFLSSVHFSFGPFPPSLTARGHTLPNERGIFQSGVLVRSSAVLSVASDYSFHKTTITSHFFTFIRFPSLISPNCGMG